MPRYDYCCENKECELFQCSIEKIHSMRESPCFKCETCGNKIFKQLYTSALKFSGSGFYETDYKGKK